MLNNRQRAEEFGVGGTDVCLPTTIKCQHHGAPLHSDRRAEEFKKSSTWSTTLGLRPVYLPVCGRKSQVTSRHIAVCLLAKDLMKLLYICTCVFLIYDILDYVYPSACDKKFSVQLDPYLVQRKYILRIYVSKLITTQSSSPYKVVLVSTSMVIVIVWYSMSACSPKLSCGKMRANILCVKTSWLHESPGLVIIYFFRLPNRTLPFEFSGEIVLLCMGESENPILRLAVSLRKMVTFVTWPSSRTESLV